MASGGSNLHHNCYKITGLSTAIIETSSISYIGDRYVLGEQLGLGQFGVIRSCRDLVTGDALACKSIAKNRLLSTDNVLSVKLEIEVMARLSGHPNVVDLKAVYEDAGYVHLVMELCAGGELFHLLEKNGRFSEREAVVFFRHLMEVLAYCHDMGIVHRDLKPENILLANNSSSSQIKLADFGLATYIKPGQRLYGTVGSPFYIAPEVLDGGYDHSADVWSAGVILYVLLSGMPPFGGKTKSMIFNSVRTAELRFPSDPWSNVSESAKELIAGMLCRDTFHRLTAYQVLEHPWLRSYESQDVDGQVGLQSSFSSPIMPASRDFSFGFSPPVNSGREPDSSSPSFTCRASSSPILDGDVSFPSPTTRFSFCSCCNPSSLGFSFFSPPVEHDSLFDFRTDVMTKNTVKGDSCRLLIESVLSKGAQVINGVTCTCKRNHTIGSGEIEQLDLIVSESVIRWSSCTHLPGATSLSSSLVC